MLHVRLIRSYYGNYRRNYGYGRLRSTYAALRAYGNVFFKWGVAK